MANASVEISGVRAVGDVNGSRKDMIYGPCTRQQTLAISAATATITTAVTQAELDAAGGDLVARIATDDTGCFVATGSVPDPTAVASTTATKAKRYVQAGGEIVLRLGLGDKVAVHS